MWKNNPLQRASILCIKVPKHEEQSVLISENTSSKKVSLGSTHGQNDVEKAHGVFHEISNVPNPSSIAVTLLSLRQPQKPKM
jgi:hypothetical protein